MSKAPELATKLRKRILDLGLDELSLISLQGIWPELPEAIRMACQLEALKSGRTPKEHGAEVIRDLLRFYDAETRTL